MPFDYSGSFSGSFYGDITASNGVVSSSNQINYNSIANRPVTISAFQKNSIVANNNFRQVTHPAISSSISTRLTTEEANVDTLQTNVTNLQTASGSFSTRVSSIEDAGYLTSASAAAAGFGSGGDTNTDSQTLSFNDGTNSLSISGGNSVDLSTLAGGGGGGAGLNITASDEGTALSKVVRSFDFVGNAVTATNSGNAVTVTINTSSVSLPSGVVSGSTQITSAITGGDLDMGGNKVLFGNVYNNEGDLPNASTYHGMFAHVHSTGHGYFAHGGNWIKLQNYGGLISGSAQVIEALPSGIVSSSNQVTITESQISDLGTYLTSVPSGTISSSAQITALGFGGGGSFNATPLNNFTGSAQTSISALNAATSSYLTSVPSGTVSSSQQITDLGFGGGGGSFNATPLNNFTGSAQTSISALNAATSSYLTSVPSGTISSSVQLPSGIVSSSAQISALGFGGGGGGSTNIVPLNNFTGSAQTSINALNTFSGSAISNSQTSSMSVATSSFTTGFTIFDGNRVISNTSLPNGVYNTNQGTSGSLAQFIEKVFFPNTIPSITTNGFTIGEFVASGSSVGTVSATDAEGQSITFRTASSYTADKFRIASNGAITLNTKSTASLNTDNTPGSGSHPFLVEAVDTFAGVGSKTIYIRVTPNTAPKWRQTSVGGSVITEFTHSLNENSTAANNKVRLYFTDDESDTITIGSGSVPSEFTITKAGTYVQLNQITSSLDFEVTPQYEFVLTASDEHYVSGDDTTSRTFLPFRISVVDNVIPTVNNQTLSSINENTSNGATVGSISATDSESDTIVFSNFTLLRAFKNGVNTNITSSLGGNSLYDPHSNPFQCSTAGVVTRKNGVYLNSDVADRYVYQVTVKDAFNTTSDTGEVTIPIAADAASSISDNWTNLYIIESATSSAEIKIGTNGRTGTSGQWSSGTSQRWEVKSTGNLIGLSATTGSSTTLRLASNLSGSAYSSGSIIAVELTASEHGFETTKQYINQNISVVINNAPSLSFSNTSANLNTNGARSGSTLTTISFTDTEGDSLNHNSFTFTDPSGQLNSIKSGDTYLVQATQNLSASVYQITASIKDNHGFRAGKGKHDMTIAQAPIGTLGGDTTSYIIETALDNAVLRDATGFGNGNVSQLTVSYSPQYNSAAVQEFTSSNDAIRVDGSGNLTMGIPLLGSPTASGDTIPTTITYRDQFGNIGSGSVTVNVFANQAPTATITNVGSALTASVSANTNLANVTISDTESDTPFSASLSGASAGSLKLVPQNAVSSSYQIQNTSIVNSGTTFTYNLKVSDAHGKNQTYSGRTINIIDQQALVYGYGWTGGSAASEAAAIASMGDSGADEASITSGSVIAHLQSGSLGTTFNPSYVGGTMTLHHSASLSTMSDSATSGLSQLGYFNFSSGGDQRLIILFASASNQGGKPVSMYDGVPPDSTGTANEYYIYAKDASIPGTLGTGVYYFNLQNAHQGYTRWGMIFAEGENTNNSRYYLMPDSASAP